MTRGRARCRAAVAAVLAATVLAGCGVGTQDQPTPISRDEVPFGLLREPPSTTAPPTTTTVPPEAAPATSTSPPVAPG